MGKAINHVQAFIAMNTTAYTAASKVFAKIESQSDAWAEALASAGIMGPDIRVFAVAYVASQKGMSQPHPSRKGGALTFKKDSKEDNRVKYLVQVATGAAAAKAARRSSSKTDIVATLLASYKKLTPAQKRSFLSQL